MGLIARLGQQEDLNFLLTNYLPRRLATRFIGWLSRIEHPLIRDLSLWVWQRFAPALDLSDASKQAFTSLHDCFIRELKPGARPIAPGRDVVTSPCDAIVGAFGQIYAGQLLQVKGSPYELSELLQDAALARAMGSGRFITLRLTSTMYHRFHAPLDCHVSSVRYISGDVFNVNPTTLKRLPKLFCRNERAVIPLELNHPSARMLLVPVAAVLVASLRLHCLEAPLNLSYRGPHDVACNASYPKGAEMGYFQHGSTIVLLTSDEFDFAADLSEGQTIRMGEPLLTVTATPGPCCENLT